MCFQDPYGSFDPLWTVARLIAEPYYLVEAAPNAAERARRVARVLEQVGGGAASDGTRFPHEFSAVSGSASRSPERSSRNRR